MGYEYRPEDRAANLVKGYHGSVIDHPDKWAAIQADIIEAIKQAVTAEREACAKIADQFAEELKSKRDGIPDQSSPTALMYMDRIWAATDVAAMIRARK